MKTKLLILISRFLDGGIDTVMLEYLRNFDHDRFELTLVIGIKMDELEVFIHKIPRNIKVEYLISRPMLTTFRKQKVKGDISLYKKVFDELLLNPFRRYMMQQKLEKLASKNDIIIDFDCTYYSFLKKIPTTKISFFHFSFLKYVSGNLNRLARLGRKLETYDKIVTISEAMKQEGESLFPNIKDKLVCIYNSFDFDTIRNKALQIPNDERIRKKYIVAVERLEESQKDLTTLIKAYKIVADQNKIEEKLYIIGEGKSRVQLETLTHELGLDEQIYFLGFITNPYPWIAQSRLLVHSSKFEGLPTVLIEAMILEKGIVSTDCPTGPKEILGNGKAGLLVPIGDEKALAKAIYSLLTDKILEDKLITESKKHIELFNIERNIQYIESLCKK